MKETIVYTGTNVLQSNTEVLTAAALYDLSLRIAGDGSLSEEVARLRKIAAMDHTAYQRVKTRLPYFCCAAFNNGIRKSENFRSIGCFVIDLDKIPADRMVGIRQSLVSDPRVKMLYTSPGGKGLKVVFELDQSCDSQKQFSDFYKMFSYHLKEMYALGDLLDKSTCDATRVSFLSHDPEVWYNALSEPVVMNGFLPDEIFIPSHNDIQTTTEAGQKLDDIPEETYRAILQKLNPDARPASKKKQIFVPDQLQKIEVPVKAEFLRLGILVTDVRDINYGKQFAFSMGFRKGEVNLFYGSRGFSVVQSMKSGTDPKLNEVGEMVVRKVLAEGRPSDRDNTILIGHQIN